jgi:hypothetical protein
MSPLARELAVPASIARALRAAASALALAVLASVVHAGDYHEGSTLDCAQCHVMHLRTGVGSAVPLAAAGPLLREDINDLCLACHDDSRRAVDVLGTNNGRSPADVRQAGLLNRLGIGRPGTGHTLDSLEVAPGSSPPWSAADEPHGAGRGLDCIHCHTPHGGRDQVPTYRNLRGDAGHNGPGQGLVTYNQGAPGANDLSRDVFQRAELWYDESAVDFNEPNARDSALARFCAGCHGEFHGSPGDARTVGGTLGDGGRYRGFVRHPAAGVDLGSRNDGGASASQYNLHANKVKVLSSTGVWNPVGSDATPSCISCHKAHGNDNEFGLIFRSGRGRLTENGDTNGTQLEHLCGQCHTEASAFAQF